ncbi:MAG: ATPase [Bacteroidales bacterium]|nr:ATPase [Bacteroidales bacterium]
MNVIADSGSSKTDWSLVKSGVVLNTVNTMGFNPFFIGHDQIVESLEKELDPFLEKENIEHVYFYGAGCGSEIKSSEMYDALRQYFINAEIIVESDLLGAARALFGTVEGIVGILGTGSNSGYYDGVQIAERIPSLGYFFGDEGSGAHLGKKLLTAYLKKHLPGDLKKAFDERYNLDLVSILESFYKNDYPNRFLASFTVFIADHREHPFIEDLIYYTIAKFFTDQIKHYPKSKEIPVSIIGSVAMQFKDVIYETGNKYDITVNEIIAKPIQRLVEFHNNHPAI